MRILVVSSQPETGQFYRQLSEAASWDIIQYTSALKAIDNIDEVSPDVVVWSYNDFPRHWKMLKSLFLHGSRSPLFILVSENQISQAELDKAISLHMDLICHDGFFSDNIVGLLGKHALLCGDSHSGTPMRNVEAPTAVRLLLQDEAGSIYVCEKIALRQQELRCHLVPSSLHVMPRPEHNYKGMIIWQNQTVNLHTKLKQANKDGNLLLVLLGADELFYSLFNH